MPRYIDVEDYRNNRCYNSGICHAVTKEWEENDHSRCPIFNMPSADIEIVRPGEWIRMKAYPMEYICSECGDLWPDERTNFCPNCGAKMDFKRH